MNSLKTSVNHMFSGTHNSAKYISYSSEKHLLKKKKNINILFT